jgi:hypothetical protein
MAKIIDNGGKEVSEAMVIKGYFGMRPGDNTTGFMNELKALGADGKTELAHGAAKMLGYTVQP